MEVLASGEFGRHFNISPPHCLGNVNREKDGSFGRHFRVNFDQGAIMDGFTGCVRKNKIIR